MTSTFPKPPRLTGGPDDAVQLYNWVYGAWKSLIIEQDVSLININATAPLEYDSTTATLNITVTGVSNGDILQYDGSAWVATTLTSGGDVVGPSSAVDTAIAVFDNTTGKLIQESTVRIDNLGNVTQINDLTAAGDIAVTGTVDGRDVATDGTKLDGIEALADVTDATNVLAALASANIDTTGSITADSGFLINTDTVVDYVDTPISSAEILSLHTTPKTIVAAPGANKALVYVGSMFFLDYNSAAYAAIAGGDDLEIRYTDASGSIVGGCETTGFLDQSSDQFRWADPVGAVVSAITPAVNAALVLDLIGAITTGDSPMGVRTYYRVIDLSTLSAT